MAVFTDVVTVAEGDPWLASQHNLYVRDNFAVNVPGIYTAKGDLPLATGSKTIARLAVGTDGQTLETWAAATGGRRWVNNGLVPLGGIVIWSGAAAAIPAGYLLCDGNNGTPNLTDRFIMGALNQGAIGATGGAATINLQHDHALTLAQAGDHTHGIGATASGGAHAHTASGSTAAPGGAYNTLLSSGSPRTDQYGHTHTLSGTTDSSGAHIHSLGSIGTATQHSHTLADQAALSAAQSTIPPYYALCYVMRVA